MTTSPSPAPPSPEPVGLACPHCAYPLLDAHADAGRCSECGTEIDIAAVRRAAQMARPGRFERALASTVLAAITTFIIALPLLATAESLGRAGPVVGIGVALAVMLVPTALAGSRGRRDVIAHAVMLPAVLLAAGALVSGLYVLLMALGTHPAGVIGGVIAGFVSAGGATLIFARLRRTCRRWAASETTPARGA